MKQPTPEQLGSMIATITRWIRDNVEPCHLYGDKRLIEDIRSEYEPEHVYGRKALEEWARDNGYVKAASDPAPVSGVATGERGGES